MIYTPVKRHQVSLSVYQDRTPWLIAAQSREEKNSKMKFSVLKWLRGGLHGKGKKKEGYSPITAPPVLPLF